jgi:hypothetical protein
VSAATLALGDDRISTRRNTMQMTGNLARKLRAAVVLAAVVALAGAGLALTADGAFAAAELQVNNQPPAALAPGQTGSGSGLAHQVSLTNVGDAPVTPGSVTVTIELPPELTAASVTPDGGRWSCVSSSDMRTVTCTGPTAPIPAGSSQCEVIIFGPTPVPCAISLALKADRDAPKGAVPVTVRACLPGQTECASSTETVAIQNFGDDFGFAPINQPGTESVAALAGETQAFWAGACDTAAAPPFGASIPAPGVGSRPATVLVSDGNLNAVAVPAPVTPSHCIDWGFPTFYQLQPGLWANAPSWRLAPVTQAGARPDGSTTLAFRRLPGGLTVDGAVDNIVVDLPPGFVGNPKAATECSAEQFAVKPPQCPPSSQVGLLQLYLEGFSGATNHGNGDYTLSPVYNLEPREGRVAEFGFAYASGEKAVTVRLTAKVRSSTDLGVTAFVGQIPAALPPVMQTITLWGVPWAAHNDLWRAPEGIEPSNVGCSRPAGLPLVVHYISPVGLPPECQQSYDPSWGDIKPLLTNETDCNPAPVVTGRMDQYLRPGSFSDDGEPVAGDPNWKTATSTSPPVTGCEGLAFPPDIAFAPTTSAADGSTGLKVDLSIPQNNDLPFAPPPTGAAQAAIDGYVADAGAYWRSPAGRATAHLKDSVVTLPPGVSVNPSAATGLQACSDAQVGLRELGAPPRFNNQDPLDGAGGVECPQGSVIGTVSVRTPVLDETLDGHVVLGQPKSTDPQSGEMLRMFLIVRNKARGLLIKVHGSAKADPHTGQVVATFANNPELPFDHLALDFKGGAKGLLALPQRCGNPGWTAAFTPWSSVGAATPVADSIDGGAFAVSQNCANAFSPALSAGMDSPSARSSGTFAFKLTRQDGEQYLRGLTARLPKGLLASVRDVPLCSNAAANAGACPAGSKIGLVDAKAGSGDPFVLEEKGEVFLTEGYKGGEYGLAVKIRPIAGPFRGAMELSPIVVRQAIHVDRRTAQVTAVSDPFPLIHHGVPLRVREVTVLVDRGGFMLNPSDCAAKQVSADIASDQGAISNASSPFRASGCASLAFKPKLALRLTGRKQVRTGKHPGIRAVVTQRGTSEAGIEKAEVRLPKSLALDVDNAQALCEFEDGTKPDLESHCPTGSIVGRSRAVSPLLNDPLVGNVYFVKNVRRSASGNLIRTLPMIVVALRGEIAINLVGESNVKKGKLVNTFDQVPDAPISRFNLNIRGGKNGIVAVTRTRKALINLCAAGRQVAEADIDGHNGRRFDRDVRMKTPCSKAAKRKAKRAAAKRKAKRVAARRVASRSGT